MAEAKRSRHSHLNSFRPDLNGDYVYTGPLYHYAGATPFRGAVKAMGVWSCLLGAAVLATGFIEAPAMLNCFYVILPFLGEVICVALAIWSVCRIAHHGDTLREYVYQRSVERLVPCLCLTFGFAGAGLLGNLVFVLSHGFLGKTLATLAVFALRFAVIAAAQMLLRHARAMSWRCGEANAPSGE